MLSRPGRRWQFWLIELWWKWWWWQWRWRIRRRRWRCRWRLARRWRRWRRKHGQFWRWRCRRLRRVQRNICEWSLGHSWWRWGIQLSGIRHSVLAPCHANCAAHEQLKFRECGSSGCHHAHCTCHDTIESNLHTHRNCHVQLFRRQWIRVRLCGSRTGQQRYSSMFHHASCSRHAQLHGKLLGGWCHSPADEFLSRPHWTQRSDNNRQCHHHACVRNAVHAVSDSQTSLIRHRFTWAGFRDNGWNSELPLFEKHHDNISHSLDVCLPADDTRQSRCQKCCESVLPVHSDAWYKLRVHCRLWWEQ